MSLFHYWEYGLPLFIIILLVVYRFYFRKIKVALLNIDSSNNFFQSEFGPIYYNIKRSKGPSVLLIHGLGSSSFCWRKLVPYFSPHYQLILPDLWGFGKSSKDHLNKMDLDTQTQVLMELMDHLNIEKFHVIGHSMGGHIALWLTRKFPLRVSSLIAIAPPSHPSIISGILSKGLWLSHLTPFFINRSFVKKILNNIFIDKLLITEELIDSYYEPYTDPKAHLSFARAITIIKDPRVFNELQEIKTETLLLYGAKDKVIKRKIIDEIHSKLPLSSLKISAVANHMPMEDDVSWLSQQILTFLKSGTDV